MQCRFITGKGMVVASFMVRMLQESYGKKWRLYVFCGFIESLFRIPREVTEWASRKKGVNGRFVTAVMQLYEGANTNVKVGCFQC